MRRLLTEVGIVAILLSGVLSCSMRNYDDDIDGTYSGSRYNLAYGTVVGTPADFKVILDSGIKLVILQKLVNIPSAEEIDGQRMLVNFTILSEEKTGDKTLYYVRLNGMEKLDPRSDPFSR